MYPWTQTCDTRHTQLTPKTERFLEKNLYRLTADNYAVKYTRNAKPVLTVKEPYHTWFFTKYKTLYVWGQSSDNDTPEKHQQPKGLLSNIHRNPPLRVMLLSTNGTLSQNKASRKHITPHFLHSTKLCIPEDKTVTVGTPQKHPQLKGLLRKVHRDPPLKVLLFSAYWIFS